MKSVRAMGWKSFYYHFECFKVNFYSIAGNVAYWTGVSYFRTPDVSQIDMKVFIDFGSRTFIVCETIVASHSCTEVINAAFLFCEV